MSEELLGFQLRVSIESLEPWVNTLEDGKRLYSLYQFREDIRYVLSVYRGTWPFSEDREENHVLFENYYPDINESPNGLRVCNIRSKDVLKRVSYPSKDVLIAITVVNNAKDTANKLRESRDVEILPYSLDDLKQAGWQCLGFDVADERFCSGISTELFLSNEEVGLRKNFADKLNKYGLFELVDDADKYRIDCDNRATEHAPFIVYGIWAKIA